VALTEHPGSEALERDRADVIAAPDDITHLRYPDSDVIVLVPELMGEATGRGDRLDREAIFDAA
jgi:hypothetical protein